MGLSDYTDKDVVLGLENASQHLSGRDPGEFRAELLDRLERAERARAAESAALERIGELEAYIEGMEKPTHDLVELLLVVSDVAEEHGDRFLVNLLRGEARFLKSGRGPTRSRVVFEENMDDFEIRREFWGQVDDDEGFFDD